MEVWCFGVYLGSRNYPKESSDYADIATVKVDGNGYVTVNGKSAGRWSDMVE